MWNSLWIAAPLLVLAGYFGYRSYRRYALHKWGDAFVAKYFGPHPKHPVFGTIKGGKGDGWEFRAPLATPGLLTAEVYGSLDSDPTKIHVRNYEELCGHWPTVWPLACETLKQEVIEYGAAESLTTDLPKVLVDIPDLPFAEETEWSIALEFEPFAGYYYVKMLGWTKVLDSGATF